MDYRNNRTGKYSRDKQVKTNRKSAVLVILTDILVVGLILLTFAFFHHVLPAVVSEMQRENEVIATEKPTEDPAPTEPTALQTEPVESTEPQPEETVADTEATEAPTEPPKELTPWQVKFAEHFSDEVIMTENSYKSPNVSIEITTHTKGEGSAKQTYHVADIYVASLDNFVTYTANNELRYFSTQDVMEMHEISNAILSISGDFMTYQKEGFLMRNREIYSDNTNAASICVLFSDGTIEAYDGRTYDVDEIKSRDPLQVWTFGPVLLDENGHVRDKYKVSSSVSQTNPRSALGYYEPGHYCFVVVDGRQSGYSTGMTIPELAAVFEELGCSVAYNLDGGGSAVMLFNEDRYSKQSNGGNRKIGDILLIREAPVGAEENVE